MKVSSIVRLEATTDELNHLLIETICRTYGITIKDIEIQEDKVILTGVPPEEGSNPQCKVEIPDLVVLDSKKRKVNTGYKHQFKGLRKSVREYLDVGYQAPLQKIFEFMQSRIPNLDEARVRKTLRTMEEVEEVDPDIFKRVS